jgi:hypothetical protein
MESAPVLGWADAEHAQECPAHRLGGAVSACARDLLDAVSAVLQLPPRGLKPNLVDVAAGCNAHFRGERAGELPFGQVGALGESGHRQVVAWVLGDPLLQRAQRGPAGELTGQLHAELCLIPGPAQEYHLS